MKTPEQLLKIYKRGGILTRQDRERLYSHTLETLAAQKQICQVAIAEMRLPDAIRTLAAETLEGLESL